MMHIHVILRWLIEIHVLILLTIVLLVSSDSPNYVSIACQETNSYVSESAFETNLNDTLFTQLLPKSSTVKFWNFIMGLDEDQVYALFFCKDDVDAQTCQDCVEAATTKIKDVCEFWKEGIVWYQECTLRYANRDIFSIGEVKPNSPYLNNTGLANDDRLGKYEEKFDSKMEALIQQAAYGKGSLQGFATNEVILSSTEIIHGLAQCTPDILGPICYGCLSAALRLRDSWAYTMMFLPSCFFRYDLYLTESPPPPLPPPRTLQAFHISLIVVLPLVLVLAVIGGIWLRKRCTEGRTSDPNRNKSHNSPGMQPGSPVTEGGGRVNGLPQYTFAQVERITNKFTKQVGRGGYGIVYHGQLLDGSREVAVKMLNENDAPTQFNNEIDVLVRILHKNLVSLLGYFNEGTKLGLIYEYMDNGDLRALLNDKADSLSWTDRLKIAIDTAEGLDYLHRNCEDHIVHRDVKPANILINKNLQAKVADFGLSKIFPERDLTTILSRVIGSFGYKAPEYAATGLLNDKADVYSFGIVLVELITGKRPSLGFDLVDWFVNIYNTGDIERLLDERMIRANEQQTMQAPDNGSVWRAAKVAKKCVQESDAQRPDMWSVVVKLKECLEIELRNNVGNSRTGHTSTRISPVVSSSITMTPDVR